MKRSLLIVVILLAITAVPVLAADGDPAIPTDITVFLEQLARGVFGGVLVSILASKSKWFADLSSNLKFTFIALVSIVPPVLATALLQFVPAGVWEAIQPYWKSAIDGLLIVFTGSQVYYRFSDKE